RSSPSDVSDSRLSPAPGESTTSGRRPGSAGASARAWVLTVVRIAGSSGRPVLATIAADTASDVYGAGTPYGTAGYQRDTMSSRCSSGRQGSRRSGSTKCAQVVPTGSGPVGAGRLSAGSAVGSAEVGPPAAGSAMVGSAMVGPAEARLAAVEPAEVGPPAVPAAARAAGAPASGAMISADAASAAARTVRDVRNEVVMPAVLSRADRPGPGRTPRFRDDSRETPDPRPTSLRGHPWPAG